VQSGLSPHYVFLCRKFTRKLAEAFPGRCISDVTTAALDKWLGNLKFGATTKNDMRRVLGTFGSWCERQGHLLKGSSPFPGMVRYRETKVAVSIFIPAQIESLLKKAGAGLRPFLAIGAFAGLRTAELQRFIRLPASSVMIHGTNPAAFVPNHVKRFPCCASYIPLTIQEGPLEAAYDLALSLSHPNCLAG
jgi:hypothetical protein